MYNNKRKWEKMQNLPFIRSDLFKLRSNTP